MRKTFFGLCMLSAIAGAGQTVVDVDKDNSPMSNRVMYTSGGHPVSTTKYVKITGGSPYLSETWMKGALITPDSIEFSNLRLRLDLLENTVIYLDENNQEMSSVAPISTVSLRDTLTGKVYLFEYSPYIKGAGTDKVWYQVLSSGKVKLYKQYFKHMFETKPYGSSITEESIKTEERYFVLVNGQMTRIKKPKDVLDFVSDKRNELGSFIDSKKLSGKKETDFVSAIEYYNSL